MALPIPTVPGRVLAAPSLHIPAGGVALVTMTGFFMPPRILVAPAGTRLPRGVHAVVAVPAAPGSAGCPAAMRWAVAAVAAPAAGDAGDDDNNLQDDDAFYGYLEAKGVEAMEMLSCIEPPARLIGKAELIKDALEKAVKKAKAKEEDKFDCVKALLHGIYGVIDLAKKSAPQQAPPGVLNFDEQWFRVMVLAARVDDTEAMMESVTRAMRIARDALDRCICHTAAGAKKLPRFEDPEEYW